jgi:hypothetical protein
LWNFPVFRLPDSYQAPRSLLHGLREVVQVIGSHTDVLKRVTDILVIRQEQCVEMANEVVSLFQSPVELIEVRLNRLTKRSDRSVRVSHGRVDVGGRRGP